MNPEFIQPTITLRDWAEVGDSLELLAEVVDFESFSLVYGTAWLPGTPPQKESGQRIRKPLECGELSRLRPISGTIRKILPLPRFF